MNMKNILIGTAVSAAVMTMSGPAFAAGGSAKFAASYDTTPLTAWADAEIVEGLLTRDAGCLLDGESTDDTGTNTNDGIKILCATVEMATMKVPEGKEVLIGVSAESLINLVTEAKGGKNADGGFSSAALAEGSVDVMLSLVNGAGETCGIAPSNSVTLNAEMRKLTVSGDATLADGEEFWVEVGIETESKSANHFEFLGVDCPGGDYTLEATFDLTALAEASGVDASAAVAVTLYDRMITMQEVRAVKGSVIDPDA